MPFKAMTEAAIPESIEKAWRESGEIGVCKASIVKYAKVLDMTDSGRDIKPLVSGMFEMIDRLKSLEAKQTTNNTTPLLRILDKAANE